MSHVVQSISGPLIFGGDFNNLLSTSDRFQGAPMTEGYYREFATCHQNNELHHLRMVGEDFTWCNNQEGAARIYSLIDRVVANAAWLSQFSGVVVEILGRNVSDHCPLLLKLEEFQINTGRPFRFINALADHSEFTPILTQTWQIQCNSNKLLNVWYKLKELKRPLKQLNSCHYMGIHDKLELLRGKLKEIQDLIPMDRLNPSI